VISVNFSNLFFQDTDFQIWILSHMVVILSVVLTCMHLLIYKMTVDIIRRNAYSLYAHKML